MERREVRLDPAVEAVLGDGARRSRERRMGRAERRKVGRDRERSKATFDLPEWLVERIQARAAGASCSMSGLAGFLLAAGLRELEAGRLDLDGHLQPSRSPRFEWVVEVRED